MVVDQLLLHLTLVFGHEVVICMSHCGMLWWWREHQIRIIISLVNQLSIVSITTVLGIQAREIRTDLQLVLFDLNVIILTTRAEPLTS